MTSTFTHLCLWKQKESRLPWTPFSSLIQLFSYMRVNIVTLREQCLQALLQSWARGWHCELAAGNVDCAELVWLAGGKRTFQRRKTGQRKLKRCLLMFPLPLSLRPFFLSFLPPSLPSFFPSFLPSFLLPSFHFWKVKFLSLPRNCQERTCGY